jgi:hypothetical protein
LILLRLALNDRFETKRRRHGLTGVHRFVRSDRIEKLVLHGDFAMSPNPNVVGRVDQRCKLSDGGRDQETNLTGAFDFGKGCEGFL